MRAIDFILLHKAAISRPEARRLLAQGAVRINDVPFTFREGEDANKLQMTAQPGDTVRIRKKTFLVTEEGTSPCL